MANVDAVIEDAKTYKVSDLWRRKPKGLAFEDTDAIVVTARTSEGKLIRETFYVAIKPDGTFNSKTLSRSSDMKRLKLVNFLTHYEITGDIKRYNIVEGMKDWTGKKVEVVEYKDGGFILIP